MKFHPTMGPKRWTFRDPDTGHEFNALSKDRLEKQIVAYRTQNRLETIVELSLVIDNYLCNLKENIGACVPCREMKRGLFAYIAGGVALVKMVAYKKIVSQEEADRRSDMCIKCPKNTFPDRGGFLMWADSLWEAALANFGEKKSKNHISLGSCEVCTCALRCKVFYDGKVSLTKRQVKEMESLPNGCWQLELNK